MAALELDLFARLFDKPGTPAARARLPLVHSTESLEVLRKLAMHPRRLRDLGDDVFGTVMWDETGAQADGTIKRETRLPGDVSQWILSGPHFYVATPLNKSPRMPCRHNQDYDPIDLVNAQDEFLPRTNYVPACDAATYLERTPRFAGRPVTDFYRHVHRRMMPLTGERSLAAALAPRGVGHTNPVVSLAFTRNTDLVAVNAMAASLVVDFFIRSKGSADLYPAGCGVLPQTRMGPTRAALSARGLRLNWLTTHHYAALVVMAPVNAPLA